MSGRFLTLLISICAAAAGSTALHAQEGNSWAPFWLLNSLYSPSFNVQDTVNKYGRYGDRPKTITLGDLIKFHGHFCGGLVESAGALRVAFNELFGSAPIDRTDLRIASNNSACGGDVAAYLTGARTRFGSHVLDPSLTESEFVVQRIANGKIVRVRVNPDAYPQDVRAQMKKIESGQFTTQDIDLFQQLQWDYAKRIVTRPLNQTFLILDPSDYRWPEAACRDFGTRKDNDYKLVPAK
jgi:formylmethanofuran dehydrogenase subunit E